MNRIEVAEADPRRPAYKACYRIRVNLGSFAMDVT
jgi:hypothetical protein